MKKLDNFSSCLAVLKKSDIRLANEMEIYRTGVVGQFNITFELAWKSIKEALIEHGIDGSQTGSPKEILQPGYKFGFIEDQEVRLSMLKKLNISVHIYDEDAVDELVLLIRDSFIPAFSKLEETLRQKTAEA